MPWCTKIEFLATCYLKEEGCTAAYATFLEECRHLSEYAQLLHAGREYSTKVGGLSLKEIANGYSHLSAEKKAETSGTNSRSFFNELDTPHHVSHSSERKHVSRTCSQRRSSCNCDGSDDSNTDRVRSDAHYSCSRVCHDTQFVSGHLCNAGSHPQGHSSSLSHSEHSDPRTSSQSKRSQSASVMHTPLVKNSPQCACETSNETQASPFKGSCSPFRKFSTSHSTPHANDSQSSPRTSKFSRTRCKWKHCDSPQAEIDCHNNHTNSHTQSHFSGCDSENDLPGSAKDNDIVRNSCTQSYNSTNNVTGKLKTINNLSDKRNVGNDCETSEVRTSTCEGDEENATYLNITSQQSVQLPEESSESKKVAALQNFTNLDKDIGSRTSLPCEENIERTTHVHDSLHKPSQDEPFHLNPDQDVNADENTDSRSTCQEENDSQQTTFPDVVLGDISDNQTGKRETGTTENMNDSNALSSPLKETVPSSDILKTPLKRSNALSLCNYKSPRRKSGVPKRRSMEVSGRRPVAALSNSDHSNSSDSNPGGERKPIVELFAGPNLSKFAVKLAKKINKVKFSAESPGLDDNDNVQLPQPDIESQKTDDAAELDIVVRNNEGVKTGDSSTVSMLGVLQQQPGVEEKDQGPLPPYHPSSTDTNNIEPINDQISYEIAQSETGDQQSCVHPDSGQDLDKLLEDSQMTNTDVNEIVGMMRNDPEFDTLFSMFSVDKHDYIEKNYGVSASEDGSAACLSESIPSDTVELLQPNEDGSCSFMETIRMVTTPYSSSSSPRDSHTSHVNTNNVQILQTSQAPLSSANVTLQDNSLFLTQSPSNVLSTPSTLTLHHGTNRALSTPPMLGSPVTAPAVVKTPPVFSAIQQQHSETFPASHLLTQVPRLAPPEVTQLQAILLPGGGVALTMPVGGNMLANQVPVALNLAGQSSVPKPRRGFQKKPKVSEMLSTAPLQRKSCKKTNRNIAPVQNSTNILLPTPTDMVTIRANSPISSPKLTKNDSKRCIAQSSNAELCPSSTPEKCSKKTTPKDLDNTKTTCEVDNSKITTEIHSCKITSEMDNAQTTSEVDNSLTASEIDKIARKPLDLTGLVGTPQLALEPIPPRKTQRRAACKAAEKICNLKMKTRKKKTVTKPETVIPTSPEFPDVYDQINTSLTNIETKIPETNEDWASAPAFSSLCAEELGLISTSPDKSKSAVKKKKPYTNKRRTTPEKRKHLGIAPKRIVTEKPAQLNIDSQELPSLLKHTPVADCVIQSVQMNPPDASVKQELSSSQSMEDRSMLCSKPNDEEKLTNPCISENKDILENETKQTGCGKTITSEHVRISLSNSANYITVAVPSTIASNTSSANQTIIYSDLGNTNVTSEALVCRGNTVLDSKTSTKAIQFLPFENINTPKLTSNEQNENDSLNINSIVSIAETASIMSIIPAGPSITARTPISPSTIFSTPVLPSTIYNMPTGAISPVGPNVILNKPFQSPGDRKSVCATFPLLSNELELINQSVLNDKTQVCEPPATNSSRKKKVIKINNGAKISSTNSEHVRNSTDLIDVDSSMSDRIDSTVSDGSIKNGIFTKHTRDDADKNIDDVLAELRANTIRRSTSQETTDISEQRTGQISSLVCYSDSSNSQFTLLQGNCEAEVAETLVTMSRGAVLSPLKNTSKDVNIFSSAIDIKSCEHDSVSEPKNKSPQPASPMKNSVKRKRRVKCKSSKKVSCSVFPPTESTDVVVSITKPSENVINVVLSPVKPNIASPKSNLLYSDVKNRPLTNEKECQINSVSRNLCTTLENAKTTGITGVTTPDRQKAGKLPVSHDSLGNVITTQASKNVKKLVFVDKSPTKAENLNQGGIYSSKVTNKPVVLAKTTQVTALEKTIEKLTNIVVSRTNSPVKSTSTLTSTVKSTSTFTSPVKSASTFTSPVKTASTFTSTVKSASTLTTPVTSARTLTTPVKSARIFTSPVKSASTLTSPVKSASTLTSPVKSIKKSTNLSLPPSPQRSRCLTKLLEQAQGVSSPSRKRASSSLDAEEPTAKKAKSGEAVKKVSVDRLSSMKVDKLLAKLHKKKQREKKDSTQ